MGVHQRQWEEWMRHINLETWSRRAHFELFDAYDQPHFGMTANVDITPFFAAVKRHQLSFTVATTYVLTRIANGIREFRTRARPSGIVEHAVIHPSVTILTDADIFNFCPLEYLDSFEAFARNSAEIIHYRPTHPELQDALEERDDLYFFSPIPWVSFTSFTHPMTATPGDSIPRFAWGKVFQEGDALKLPLSVQGHHGLMDGAHIGRYYERVEAAFCDPDCMLFDASSSTLT